jgi:predicted metal-dependent HD superfamily phosphohydrolase
MRLLAAVRRLALTAGDVEDFQDMLRRAPVAADAKHGLVSRMTSADRYYHDAFHLVQLWRRHRQHARSAGMDVREIETLIACAIAYHDAVFDAQRSDNEERSAQLWLVDSDDATMDDADRQWVAGTIRATRDHANRQLPEDDRACIGSGARLRQLARDWVLDLDLTPLGMPRRAFERNTRLLRREASASSDAEYEARQRAFFFRFLSQERIYHTPVLAAEYEVQARRNIARALAGP